jgi:hypothetical protein
MTCCDRGGIKKMRKITMFLVCIMLVTSCLLFFPIKNVQAGFGVSPPYVNESHLLPGSHYETIVYLSQSDPSNLTYCDVTIDESEIQDWITIDQGFYFPFWDNLFPMGVNIDVPENVSLGNYSGFIRVRKLVYDQPGGQITVVLGARIDVSLTVIDYNYTSFEIDIIYTDTIHISEPMIVRLLIDNHGNTYTCPPYVIVDTYNSPNTQLLETHNLTNWTPAPPFTRSWITNQCQLNLPCGNYWNHVYGPNMSTWLEYMQIVPFPSLSNLIPENGSTIVPTNTNLSWSCEVIPNCDWCLTYDVYFGTVNPPPQIISNQTEKSFIPILNYSTTYYWKIIARDFLGYTTASPILTFTTLAIDQPPNMPRNPSPPMNASNVSITTDLSWTGGDPNGYNVTYDVFFGTINPPPCVSQNQTVTSYNPGLLNYSQTCYWRIESENSLGVTTLGPVWTFTTYDAYTYYEVKIAATSDRHIDEPMSVFLTIENQGNTYTCPPYVNVGIYDINNINLLETHNLTNWTPVAPFTRTTIINQCPCNLPYGQYWVHINIPDKGTWLVVMGIIPYPALSNPIPENGSTIVPTNTTLSWSCVGVPNCDWCLTYDVYFGTVNPPPQIISNQTEKSFIPILNYSTTYYWKIIARDYIGGNCIGPLWSFTTAPPNEPPYPPSNPYPPNNTTDIPLTADLSWNGSDPNEWDTITYDVYFGTNNPPPMQVNNQSGTAYNLGTLSYQTTYYWMIVTWDNNEASTAGAIWSFTTKANNPPIYGTPSPSNNSIGNPLQLSWGIPINDPEGDALSWSIQCSNGQQNNETEATNGTKSLPLTELKYETIYLIWVNTTDSGGSDQYTRKWYTFTTLSDTIPPTTNIFFNGTTGENSWYISPLIITLTATDDLSGVNHTMYKLDTENWNIYTNPLTIYDDNKHIIQYYSVDNAGNIEEIQSRNFDIDQTPPRTTHSFSGDIGFNGWYIGSGTFFLTAIDNTSGVSHIFYKFDSGGWIEYTVPMVLDTDGIHTLKYYSIDIAGNTEQEKGPFYFKLDKTPPVISLSKEKTGFNQMIFTAEVSDSTSGIDRVEFALDGVMQSNDTQSPYEWTWTGIGDHQVTATAYDMAGNSQSQSMSTPYELIQGYTHNQFQFKQQFIALKLGKQLLT